MSRYTINQLLFASILFRDYWRFPKTIFHDHVLFSLIPIPQRQVSGEKHLRRRVSRESLEYFSHTNKSWFTVCEMRSQSSHEIEKKNVVLCKCWFTVYIGMIRSTYTYYKVLQQNKEWYLYPLTCSSAWLSYWKSSLSKGLLQLR